MAPTVMELTPEIEYELPARFRVVKPEQLNPWGLEGLEDDGDDVVARAERGEEIMPWMKDIVDADAFGASERLARETMLGGEFEEVDVVAEALEALDPFLAKGLRLTCVQNEQAAQSLLFLRLPPRASKKFRKQLLDWVGLRVTEGGLCDEGIDPRYEQFVGEYGLLDDAETLLRCYATEPPIWVVGLFGVVDDDVDDDWFDELFDRFEASLAGLRRKA